MLKDGDGSPKDRSGKQVSPPSGGQARCPDLSGLANRTCHAKPFKADDQAVVRFGSMLCGKGRSGNLMGCGLSQESTWSGKMVK